MDSELISLAVAREKILDKLCPAKGYYQCSLPEAVSSVLAESIYASIDVPGNDNSAMDGFALRFSDIKKSAPLRVSQRIAAGALAQPLEQNSAARIFTGAMLPSGADTVVIQEDCLFSDREIAIRDNARISFGENIRKAGQDIKKSSLVFPKGHCLKAQDVGLLASLGLDKVSCYQPLKIALVSTGDELLAPGEAWRDGKIYNSNSFMLQALLDELGFEITVCKVLGDNFAEIKMCFSEYASTHDCIISTGGVSVGEEDYVKQVVQELGALDLWRLAIKPGKPLAFGEVLGKPFFGLPGNPVSAFVNFLLLVKPGLLRLQGMDKDFIKRQIEKGFFMMRADFEQKASQKRVEYLRVCREDHPEYGQALTLFANQSSGVLSSVCASDGFAVMETGKPIHKGDWVRFLPFSVL